MPRAGLPGGSWSRGSAPGTFRSQCGGPISNPWSETAAQRLRGARRPTSGEQRAPSRPKVRSWGSGAVSTASGSFLGSEHCRPDWGGAPVRRGAAADICRPAASCVAPLPPQPTFPTFPRGLKITPTHRAPPRGGNIYLALGGSFVCDLRAKKLASARARGSEAVPAFRRYL